ncbi:hypothetical protein [Comamonas sp. JC664]|uniref:hypothetical protein n=1 Tax=Comamonas sp. JC664 TaxID=2801917 RepID=UPI00174B4012|nr:hypothetical protein [Comamonas sp. JC664]MBL0698972.1 hypothetical protein [Comamonas sp. JC664]GHG79855.1 hypothetical protein GCM10012319_32140 [Comamonas sp. KCTC 72670]
MRHTSRSIRRTPKVTPELARHRATRAEYLHALAKLQGTAPEPPPEPVVSASERCHCGAPWLLSGGRKICGWGLHDG